MGVYDFELAPYLNIAYYSLWLVVNNLLDWISILLNMVNLIALVHNPKEPACIRDSHDSFRNWLKAADLRLFLNNLEVLANSLGYLPKYDQALHIPRHNSPLIGC